MVPSGLAEFDESTILSITYVLSQLSSHNLFCSFDWLRFALLRSVKKRGSQNYGVGADLKLPVDHFECSFWGGWNFSLDVFVFNSVMYINGVNLRGVT